jgi:Protein tyrosine and serine/threonine kinase
MAGDPRVLGLLEEMLDAGKAPEEVCRGCPELLAEVRVRWKEFRIIDAAVVEMLSGLRTTLGVGAVTPVTPASHPPQVPSYELFGEVGRGGMGVVYRARDLSLERDVAVKLLQDRYPADSPIARRFTDEARITAQLQHPGVPAVYRVGTLPDGRPFLAMKLIKGRTLAALLGKRADTAADRGGSWLSSSTSARQSPTPTRCGSYTGTSSRRTSWSSNSARSKSWTGAWPRSFLEAGRPARVRHGCGRRRTTGR